jgi:fatty acid desaturase
MDEWTSETADPREAIARLEQRIERLEAKIEGCRKLMLASRIAVAAGAAVLGATVVGLIVFDPTIFLAAVAAVLGGFVLLGSNRTTAHEAAGQRAEAEAERNALIGQLELHVVGGGATRH